MYKKELVEIIDKTTKVRIEEQEYKKDIRELGVDSILFIQVLVNIEEELGKEIDYTFLDNNSIVSIETLDNFISNS